MNRMQVRRFNAEGVETFRRELAECRAVTTRDIPLELLTDSRLTELVSPQVDIEPRIFVTKRDAAVYFHQIFADIPKQKLLDDIGL